MKKTKKYKNIILIIIMSLMLIFGVSSMSQAVEYKYDENGNNLGRIVKNSNISVSAAKNDKKWWIGYNDYTPNTGKGNIYCVEHGEQLNSKGDTYTVQHIISIDGLYVSDENGNGKNGLEVNAKLAFILKNAGSIKNRKKLIWKFMPEWQNEMKEEYVFGKDIIKFGMKSGDVTLNDKQQKIAEDAESYANDYSKKETATLIQKNTAENMSVSCETKDKKQYYKIGPIKLHFNPKLSSITIKNQSNNTIKNYIIMQNDNEIDVGEIISDVKFYLYIPYNPETKKVSINFKTEKPKFEKITAKIVLLEAGTKSWQNLISVEYDSKTATGEAEKLDIQNISLVGNLTIKKVDQDNTNITLSGAGFKLKNVATGQWVHQDANQVITFGAATEFCTGAGGTVTIKNLPVGKYQLYETKAPDYYEIVGPNPVEVTINGGGTAYATVKNKQKYIDLSGYVWNDNVSGKSSTNDGLYTGNDDKLLKGVKVTLMRWRKDANGTIYYNPYTDMEEVATTWTNDKGEYKFTKVLIEDLGRTFIVFEYNGMKYQSINAQYNYDNGSKAVEHSWRNRATFNSQYNTISADTSRDKSIVNNKNNEKISYNLENHKAKVIGIDDNYSEKFKITAETNFGTEHKKDAYYLNNEWTPGKKSIDNINLGLQIREQPDLAVKKDIQNVILKINGYEHTYNYAQRFENQGEYGDGFNVGVKFGNKYGSMKYTRAIYKSDYEWKNPNDTSKELQVYITYKIAIKNQATTLLSRVNNIIDYYDSRYEFIDVGTGISQEGNVTGKLNHSEPIEYNSKYKKLNINTNMTIGHQKESYVYVQFKLSRDQVAEILKDKDAGDKADESTILDNVTEINSYSIFDSNGNAYAGIDVDSAPGNAVPGNTDTYEDDTDKAPALQLEVANARLMTGKVFLDKTTNELQTGKIREGTGKYENGEEGIKNVQVTLKPTENKDGKTYETTTNENGDFEISGFIPDKYELVYTWGGQELKSGEKITLDKYKGTVYKERERYTLASPLWYKQNANERYTDAIDDYGKRREIDEKFKEIDYTRDEKIAEIQKEKMDSTTPVMSVRIEDTKEVNEKITTSSLGDKLEYKVSNVDFGIAERARQEVELTKRVKTLKLTLANGQVISDVEFQYDEKGKLTATGEKKHMTFMGTNKKGDTNRFIKLELDNELIQGANLEVGYEILFKNKSEKDYASENFYCFGRYDERDLIRITPTAVIDYLDKDWSFESNKNKDENGKEIWEAKTLEEFKRLNTVATAVYEDKESDINNKIILYTEKLSEKALEPNETNNVMLNVSKILTTTDEISLDNDTEVVKISKNGGRPIPITPGKYIPGKSDLTDLSDISEEVIVTPSTGENLNYVLPITIGLLALITLGTGVILIKKKVLDNNKE